MRFGKCLLLAIVRRLFKARFALKATRFGCTAIAARAARTLGALTAAKTTTFARGRALHDLHKLHHQAQGFVHRRVAAKHACHVGIQVHRKATCAVTTVSKPAALAAVFTTAKRARAVAGGRVTITWGAW